MVDRQIGKYRILHTLGQGGEGIVYLAKDADLGRRVALKCLRKDAHPGEGEAIRREAAFLQDLQHPMLPVVYELFHGNACENEAPFWEDGWYLAMEYIAGMSLHNYIETRGGVREEQACLWGEALLDVLIYLHTRKTPVIYGDLKPDNIIVCQDGSLKLIDFGAAFLRNYGEKGDGRLALTAGFCAPEQQGLAGRQPYADERSDIYAFGRTLYYMVTGAHPGKPPYGRLAPALYNPLLSPGFERLVERCTMEEPGERYQVAAEVLRDLRERGRFKRGTGKRGFLRRVEKQICLVQTEGCGCFAEGFRI